MALSIDLFVKSVTGFLDGEGKRDIQEINKALKKLTDLKPKFRDLLKKTVACNLEVVQTGEIVHPSTITIQEVSDVDTPDTELYPEGTDILLKRHDAEHPVFKTKDLRKLFSSNSFYRRLFEKNLTRFKSYFSESMGSEATMFFASMDTHFVKAKFNKNINPKFNYLRLKTLAMQYSGKELTKDRLTSFLVKANSMLLEDIFIEMQEFWFEALYGRIFLGLIYKDALAEKRQVHNEINNVLRKHQLLEDFKTKNHFDFVDITKPVFDFGPFFIKLKHQILANTLELAEAFYEAKKDDPEMQEFWKSPTPSLLSNTLFVYSLSKNDFVVSDSSKAVVDKLLKMTREDKKQGKQFII